MSREAHVRFWESAGLRCPAPLAYLNAYATVAEAKTGIGAWLDFYNEERQHQNLGYRTPRQIYQEGLWICGRSALPTNMREAAIKYSDPWGLTSQELMGLGMKEELIYATASRAQRSGLIYPMSGIGGFPDKAGAGNLTFRVSPLLIELGTTIDFEDAIRRGASEQS